VAGPQAAPPVAEDGDAPTVKKIRSIRPRLRVSLTPSSAAETISLSARAVTGGLRAGQLRLA
jgi:hypothetical protein